VCAHSSIWVSLSKHLISISRQRFARWGDFSCCGLAFKKKKVLLWSDYGNNLFLFSNHCESCSVLLKGEEGRETMDWRGKPWREAEVRKGSQRGFCRGGVGGRRANLVALGVCFPSGWRWPTAASINTCLHGSHISCFAPHPQCAGPHRLRTPQRLVCVCVCVSVCVHTRASLFSRSTWTRAVCADLFYLHRNSERLRTHTHTHTHTHITLNPSELQAVFRCFFLSPVTFFHLCGLVFHCNIYVKVSVHNHGKKQRVEHVQFNSYHDIKTQNSENKAVYVCQTFLKVPTGVVNVVKTKWIHFYNLYLRPLFLCAQ